MPRIRSVKPDFFRDETLQDLQVARPELNPMLVFEGLWTQSDKAGNFPWNPRMLHLDILPFIQFDFSASLSLLREARLISQYEGVDGKQYGTVLNFYKHQRISGKEATEPAKFPGPKQGIIGEATEKPPVALGRERVIGREMEGEWEESPPDDLHPLEYAKKLLQDIGFPQATANIKAVASAVESEIQRGKSKPAAYEYILACVKDLQQEGVPITTFIFTDAKYRPENRGSGKTQSSRVMDDFKRRHEIA